MWLAFDFDIRSSFIDRFFRQQKARHEAGPGRDVIGRSTG
jgi:hypothetical protein